jgi:ABC-2 type transport system ATP-binding protein
MDSITLKVDDVGASYGKFKISSVSFQLKSGDIMGLVGRSGSGKSTLLKTLIGLKKPDAGSIITFVNDVEVPLNQLVGYSPQDNSLFPFLTLEENIVTFGRLNRLKKAEIGQRMNELLSVLHLEASKEKRIKELSGGMQKRADLAVTLLHAPKIIVLDEPFTGLDISLQRFIWNFLKGLSSQGNIIIITSHILSDIQKNCNEFGLVEDGMYYDTGKLIQKIGESREKSLEFFLEKLFVNRLTQAGR